ncbi:protocadherin-23 isoform X2 [Scleropages formosus]|uniref:protocadherin-23 isoform X2 n=1 Tax=Scleropages formosus TaxID=113540 RepID=UPI0010FA694B|nr:protocadherin-23 isoform X2 [Scleropages formosus]
MFWRRMCHPCAAISVLDLLIAASLLLLEPCSAQVYNLSLSVEEGLPAGTIVGDLRALLPEETASSGFFISESRESYVFKDLEIDGDTGIIATAVVLDRESRDRYEFVAATLTGDVIKVKIDVRDVNDHSPIFRRDVVSLNISEQSPPDTRFQLEGAQDEDEGDFGTQGYRITSSTAGEIFKVENRNGGGNSFNLDFILSGRLDREVEDFYTFIIEAFDGGVPPKTGKLQVEVHVLDENDNPPVFNQSEYKVLVWENAPLLTAVCQVYATDLDLGNNGQVTYEISRRQSDPDEVFVIDSTTGLIRVNKALDYESQPLHELIIRAQDNGMQPEYSSAFVVVKVLDVNDNSPTINVMFLSESSDGEVSEGAGMGQYVARISVSDPDLGEANEIKVSLEGGDGKFTLKPSDDFLFSLCVDGELDREQVDMYELKIVASDFGVPPLWSEKTFLIKVSDVNDSPPVFDQDIYAMNISEDVLPGSALLKVRAKDVDEGLNSAVHYSLEKLEDGYLVSIDPKSGFITTVAHLDHEKESVIHVLVVAVDGGNPPLSSTATVIVHVEDVNDNEPVFEKQLYNISVPEHSPVGSCFLQVSAADADGAEFGRVRYSLVDGFDRYDKRHLFDINPESGDICVARDFDREAGHVDRDVLVKAEDQGGLSSQTYVHIEVEDINDNRPVFNPERYVTSISCHTPPGTEILTVIAADADSGTFGHIYYDLVPGDLSSHFVVDASTGSMYLASPLSHLGTASLKLSVSARDGGGLSSPRPADVTVNVLRGAPAPAIFQRSRYLFSVSEDAPAGTPVGRVQASGSIDGVERLSYEISSGDPLGHFQVHPQSGLLSTRRTLDRESQPYFLLVLQSYTSTSPIYSSAQVNVSVSDVNDNPPVFSRDQDTISVSLGTVPGIALYIVHAHDRDAGANARVRYSLLGGSAEPFVVDARLGTVFLNRSLAQDGPTTYSLRIQAEDEGTPALASVMMLSVSVDGAASEEGLAFETLVYQVEISEGAQRDSRVIQVRAHGQGRHTSSGVSYSLLSASRVLPFRIHAKSGWMVLDQVLDYESVPAYRFRVAAANSEGTATATIIVTVLDENDNAPVFTHGSYFYTIQESSSPQGLMGTVRATDRDSGKNSRLSYVLLSDGKHFRINPNTGEVINWVALDREQHTHHTLEILVTDHGFPRRNATCRVHVLVTDANDNPPQFTHLPPGREISVQFWAGLPAGSMVTTTYAKDLDAGENGTVRYSMTSDDGLGHFEIDSASGEIRSTARFSKHPGNHYTLAVVASDNGPSPLERTAVIHVQVLPDERRIIPADGWDSQGFRHFSVREDARPGTVVGSVELPEGRRGKMRYSITEGNSALHFGIDTTSGDIYVRQQLDYESTPRHLFWVRAEHSGQGLLLNRSLLIIVSIEDVNDHAPWFPDHIITFGLEENVPVGTRVYTFNARDGDGSAANSALRYSVTSEPAVPFLIDPVNGTLTVIGPIDREATESFTFTVTATDQAEESSRRKQASLTVQVHLLDTNDNSPVFVSTAEAQLAEDTPLGSPLHRFIAKDEDLGTNGLVAYSIASGNEGGHFALEEETGVLLLVSSLDYEQASFHTLEVEALDRGRPPRSSMQRFAVSVLDVNDRAPEFDRHGYAAAVDENRDPGEPVVKVTARDGDSAANAAVTYSLLPGPGYELFGIDPQGGEIRTSARLDRELWGFFSLRVLARDSGSPPLSSTATVLCSVLDDNDHAPSFSHSSFQTSVPENLPPGLIHVARAEDPDAGLNGTIQYSIEGDFGDTFVINATTGALSTLRSLDREERSSYDIIIKAQDRGAIPRTSSVALRVVVLDDNDNSPVFSQKSYHTSVSERVPVGSEVVRLTATDSDEGPGGEVSFSLLDDTLGAFSVDGRSGLVRTARPLDRERHARYAFRAAAADGCSQSPRSSVATVTVDIEDINDNAPVFTQSAATTLVTTNTPVNRIVVTVMASDADRGNNGTVEFRLSEPDALFDIGLHTGAIWLKAPLLSSGFSGTKLLRVIASDQGSPTLSSSSLVFLIRSGGAETGLRFTEQDYRATVPEHSITGSRVATVLARDQSTDQPMITYSILNGNEDGAFSIDPRAGVISVKEQSRLDFEEKKEVLLVVLADSRLQSAHCRVTITLLDVNDNAPAFERNYYGTAVWEGQVLNTYVTQVFAADGDGGVNGQIDYAIVSGNHNDAFMIDAERGILATGAVLDREIISSYKLVLHAVDRGSPRLTGTTTIQVRVADVNDNEPTIPPMEPVAIAENLPAGSTVAYVTANDVDLSGAVTYSFTEQGGADGKFAIDPYTGLITLTQSLDREERSDYVLRICASDSVHQTEAELEVQVLDVNDNSPVFAKASYQVVVPELTSAGASILAVSAADRDAGLNGKLTYRLASPSKGFYISPHNGTLYANKPLRYISGASVIQLTVEARDAGDPALAAVTSVEVQVQDSNDHAPQFQQATYQVSCAENTTVGTTLLRLSAEDQDWSWENAWLEYAITGGNEERRFRMEVSTVREGPWRSTAGKLVLCDALDRELTESYTLTVTASDRGLPPLSGTTVVTVTVLDVNDNPPVFANSEYHVRVSESSPPGTWLTQVVAHDPDEGANGHVRYDIISGNSKGRLKLDQLSGSLELNQNLDYEEDDRFALTVRASDGDGSGQRNLAFAVVFISVSDENDNFPHFTFPVVNCLVMENQPAFSPACTVHAVDHDAGPYGQLTYALLRESCSVDYRNWSPERKEAFTIDPLTGDIHTKQVFDYEREHEFCLVVEARDRGDQVATVRVQIDVEGMDEFSPIFTQPRYLFQLPENAKAGQSIGQVKAMDHDGGLDGVVQYSLASPSPFFSVNRTNGVIYLLATVYRVRGGEDFVEMLLRASSPKVDSRTTSCLVTVNVSSTGSILPGLASNVQIISLSVSLVVFLLLFISSVALILRYQKQNAAVKKGVSLTAKVNRSTETLDRASGRNTSSVSLCDMKGSVDVRMKREFSNPFRNSDSSGRGSAEGETAEDEEIKMINEHPCRKSSGSGLSDRASRVPDSGVPRDSERLSCQSEDSDPTGLTAAGVGPESSESIHTLREEGGGEEMLPRGIRVAKLTDGMKSYGPLCESQTSVGGSLSSLACTEEELRGSYGWDYLLNWEPRFQPLASVFSDIGQLPDGAARACGSLEESRGFLRPPPLITSVAQPGIRTVPPRMPPRVPGQMETLMRRPSFPKYTYSPLARNTGLTPSIMTPSFSPAISLLTVRTPNASPVLSDTGLGSCGTAGSHAEMQL